MTWLPPFKPIIRGFSSSLSKYISGNIFAKECY
nr:MAG TPA: hypothetical protein [Caudoviricetes sp.]